MQWNEIQGWFDFSRLYDSAVGRASDGARFVEVGSWLGRSTAYMVAAIKASGKDISFDAVDTWEGSTDSPVNGRLAEELAKQSVPLYEQFWANMKACDALPAVRPVRSDSAKAAESYPDGSLDFVFIDGDHALPMVKRDLEAYWPKVKMGGVLAGHDIGEREVGFALTEFCQSHGLHYYREGSSWVIEKFSVEPAKILLGVPHSGRLFADTAMSAMMHPASSRGVHVEVMTHQTSLLASGFNYLWISALSRDFTHFAMLHADIKPEWNWLDVLLAELERTGSYLVSAISPIKDERGLTSTAIGHPNIWYSPYRRLTMQDVMKLPATFDAEQAGYPGHALLHNTGCWLADLRHPAWREADGEGRLKIYFNIRDAIARTENDYKCLTQSEDWFFSTRVHAAGIKSVATRKVQLGHYSDFPWPNYAPWGKWEHDNDTRPHWDKPSTEGV